MNNGTHKGSFVLALSCLLGLALGTHASTAQETAPTFPDEITDSIYKSHHPKLFFTSQEVEDVRTRVLAGGTAGDAYNQIRYFTDVIYPTMPLISLLGSDFGLSAIPNLGVAVHVPKKKDPDSEERGRILTVYLADNYAVNLDEANSSLRLRSLALGYDMFFKHSTTAERTYIRDEIVSYLEYMVTNFGYKLFEYRPYLGNHSAMIAGALGLAAICLQDEADPALLNAALAKADRIIDQWLTYQLDPGGAYKEGVLYGAWSMRNLIYYFHARKRHDGFSYADNPRTRAMERWFAYEFLPEGFGTTNNLGASTYWSFPAALHPTYFHWAQGEWGGGLSAWIGEQINQPYGGFFFIQSDLASAVLWNSGVAPAAPDSVLQKRSLWTDRGLYYYRSGWPAGPNSREVMFSFFSGKFHGGHNQEDKNQFTLYAYGGKFAIDHGPGNTAARTSAHNLVLIDGKGQHFAGSSIGTDGEISEYLLTGFADYLLGDATSAYSTYSEFNNRDCPFPGIDWSWGYRNANPVNFALRKVMVAHSGAPYFIIVDDIEKDGLSHEYQWRMHTADINTVDLSSNPIHISTYGTGYLNLQVLNPPFAELAKATRPFDNLTAEPDATLLSLTTVAANPEFVVLLLPGDETVPPPVVSKQDFEWGFVANLVWGAGDFDCFVYNRSGGLVDFELPGFSAEGNDRSRERFPGTAAADEGWVATDASMALLGFRGQQLEKHVACRVTRLSCGGILHVRIIGEPLNCGTAEGLVHLDRPDAQFVIYGPNVTGVLYRDQPISFVRSGDFIMPETLTGIPQPRPSADVLDVRVYPNPLNPITRIQLELSGKSHVRAAIFDAAGRRVAVVWNGPLGPGRRDLYWDGTSERGGPVTSGVYFLKVEAGGEIRTVKLTVLK